MKEDNKEKDDVVSPKSEKYDDADFDFEEFSNEEGKKEKSTVVTSNEEKVTVEETKVEEENSQEQKSEEDFIAILDSDPVEGKTEEKVSIEVNTTDTYDLSNKDTLPIDKPFEDDANYYDDYSFCSDEGQNVDGDKSNKNVSSDIQKKALKELQGVQADRPESRSNSRGKN